MITDVLPMLEIVLNRKLLNFTVPERSYSIPHPCKWFLKLCLTLISYIVLFALF